MLRLKDKEHKPSKIKARSSRRT